MCSLSLPTNENGNRTTPTTLIVYHATKSNDREQQWKKLTSGCTSGQEHRVLAELVESLADSLHLAHLAAWHWWIPHQVSNASHDQLPSPGEVGCRSATAKLLA